MPKRKHYLRRLYLATNGSDYLFLLGNGSKVLVHHGEVTSGVTARKNMGKKNKFSCKAAQEEKSQQRAKR